ncbi:MAG TPA: phospholipase [Gallionella sp.]|nr:MAG: hypothetical protein A2Z87_01575 [Gallionellales bacterium GWA2_54_124]OGT17320.1 MAG: hypothetical protein A2522_08435 [Gallionellales bacterium RIFOXYD12_FULL_53_10]HCI53696.1 phospholipase [Gallionella sp.]
MKNKSKIVAFVLLSLTPPAYADAFSTCAQTFKNDAEQRLKCFDAALMPVPASATEAAQQMAKQGVQQMAESPLQKADAVIQKDAPVSQKGERSYLTRVWNLDNRMRRDSSALDRLQPHKQSYLIVRDTSKTNAQPASPAPAHAVLTPYNMDALEAKFQLSFKTDIGSLENLDLWGLKTLRVWGAYTQQSHWQVFNSRNSSPFRETNYEPELIAAFGTGRESGWKLLNLGFVHQSNGRTNPESRSWNRLYAQGGWEWDNFSLLARGWWRIPEKAATDDNPDIVHYLGRGDLVARWEPDSKSQAVALLVRNNLNLNQNIGFAQLDWSIPVSLGHAARLHAQFGTGYGESMIDYNHRQTTLGLGVSFREW